MRAWLLVAIPMLGGCAMHVSSVSGSMSFDQAPFVVTECSSFSWGDHEAAVRGVLLRDDAGRGIQLRVTSGQPLQARFYPSRYSDAVDVLGACGVMSITTHSIGRSSVADGSGEAWISCGGAHVLLGHVTFRNC